MKQGNSLPDWIRMSTITALVLLTSSVAAQTQDVAAATPPPGDSMAGAIHDLQEQVRELRVAVQELRSEAVQYRTETVELRRELEAARGQSALSGVLPIASSHATPPPSPAEVGTASANPALPQAGSLEERVAALEESSQLLGSKVDDEYQTKLESASKYRVRLSGLVLLNLFANHGTVDNQDFPTWAIPFPTSQTFGASLRQSELGLEVFGPRLAGAKTTGDLQVDFSGGFANTLNGVNYGLVRLRIASMRLDWGSTSIVAGQDNAFISPLSPTSFASVAVPAFGYAGNLWGWIPQVRVEHRFEVSSGQTVMVQGGIMDGLTGEPPADSFLRFPAAGESSGQPAYGTRVAWTRHLFGRAMTLGAAGYYSRQDWGLGRKVDGWAGMTDFEIPLAPRLSLTGELYRGRGIGGLGAGFGRSVLFSGQESTPGTQVRALNTAGGWSQLKFKASTQLEFNGGFGLDNPFAQDLRAFSSPQSYSVTPLAQNRSALANFIYRPRSDLLFSAEYRHLRSFEIDNLSPTADQVSLTMGVLF